MNYGVGMSCDEVHQVLQWRQFCLRGILACVVLIIFAFVMKPKIIVHVIELSVITLCTVEGVYSMLQLYGMLPSMHNIFKVTGSFYNPGPLGGILAAAIPLAVNRIINICEASESKILKYYLYISLIIIIITLLPTMSRTAWIAAIISTIYVLYCNGIILQLISKIKIRPRYLLFIFTVSMVVSGFFLWQIKHDSAVGRLLLWKISIRAIAAAPILGHENFASAYGAAQENYFATNGASESEKLAAGSPDYAFNEYLQIGVEYGLPILILVLIFCFFLIRKSYRAKTFGLSGALLSIMVFAFASYPLHLPVLVAVVCLILFGIVIYDSDKICKKSIAALIPLIIVLFAVLNLSDYNQKGKAICDWTRMQILYRNKCYGDVVVRYSTIYDAMSWNPRFVYEYGQSLYKSKKYAEAIPILENAVRLSADPMPLNILGECYQALQQFNTAETYYHRAANRIPSRLYPHYLLYFLYCEDGFADDSLRRIEYENVMTMTIKSESPATRDLRRLVEKKEISIIK